MFTVPPALQGDKGGKNLKFYSFYFIVFILSHYIFGFLAFLVSEFEGLIINFDNFDI